MFVRDLIHVWDDLGHYRTPNQKGMTAATVSNSRLSASQHLMIAPTKGMTAVAVSSSRLGASQCHRNQMSTRLNITVIIIAVKPTTDGLSFSRSHDSDDAKYMSTPRNNPSKSVVNSLIGNIRAPFCFLENF